MKSKFPFYLESHFKYKTTTAYNIKKNASFQNQMLVLPQHIKIRKAEQKSLCSELQVSSKGRKYYFHVAASRRAVRRLNNAACRKVRR